jgi:hypothetical protein
LRPIDWSYTVVPAYQPPGWEQADCIASDSASNLHAGRKVIWLVRDRAVLDFPQARSGAVEIAAEQHPGVIADGVYAVERTGLGALRWTSGHARFEVANAREAPVARLVLALWPMPLAADARLRLTVNDWTAFDGPVPAEPLTVPLDRFANAESLAIELETAPATRYPNDPRDLGAASREIDTVTSRDARRRVRGMREFPLRTISCSPRPRPARPPPRGPARLRATAGLA